MAGIGFRMQKLLRSGDYRMLAVAYGYAAVISSGPWMLSMLGLMAIGALTSMSSTAADVVRAGDVFRVVVIYCYAGSLMLGGFLHLAVSRYISDLLYSGDFESIFPCYLRAAAVTLGCGFVLSALWFAGSGLGFADAVGGVALFQGLSLVWLGMIYLSAAKGYETIVWGFLVAHAGGVVAAWLGYRSFGLSGMLWGYALGQVGLGGWLAMRVGREFPSFAPESNDLFQSIQKRWELALVGFLFNLGVWIDKLVVWNSAFGLNITGWYNCSPAYDTSLFFAYLSTVPAMALFLIRVETSFYRSYTVYFTAVTCGGDMAAIMEGKRRIKESLSLSASRLVKLQGGITLCLIIIAPELVNILGMKVDSIPLMRLAFLAAFLQVLLLFLFIFFLYFDWRRATLGLAGFFAGTNLLFTWFTVRGDEQYLGAGYLLSCLLSLLVGLWLFDRRMNDLEFETFSKQIDG